MGWLHQQNIRHKDLKPSQILLSHDGLWVTDFGWSRDISDLTHSTTSEGDNIILKYHSPERAGKEACGRSEDVFALGCIFLEMAYQLVRPVLQPKQRPAPWQKKGWYFQAHIGDLNDTLGPNELYQQANPLQEEESQACPQTNIRMNSITSEHAPRPTGLQVSTSLKSRAAKVNRENPEVILRRLEVLDKLIICMN